MASTRRRPRRRTTTAAVLALTLVSAALVVLPGGTGLQAAVPPVPGEIAFSRMVPNAPSPTPSPTAPPRPPNTHLDLARVVAARPFEPAPPFAGMSALVDDSDPAWSPDGHRIAFTRADEQEPNQFAIWVAAADGTGAVQLTDPPRDPDTGSWHDFEPSWSPDGSELVFTRTQFSSEGEDVPAELRIVPSTGGTARLLTAKEGVRASHPDWSPAGDVIAYRHEVNGEFGDIASIHTVPATGGDGTAMTPLVDNAQDAQPAWSPDGTRIAYIADWGFEYPSAPRPRLVVRDITAGTENVLVRSVPATEGVLETSPDDPDWSPDGQQIAYTWASEWVVSDIRAVPAAGGTPVDVAAGPTAERQPSWRPTADLRVTLSSMPLRFGQPGTITATVTNGGPAPARAAQLRLSVSSDFNPAAVDPAGCVLVATVVTCALGELAAGASVQVTVTGRPSTFLQVTADAHVESDVVDLDTGDNDARGSFGVEGTDLRITVDDGFPHLIGDAVTYPVTVSLVGGDPVERPVVELTLPDNVALRGVDVVDQDDAAVCAPATPTMLRCTLSSLSSENSAVQLLVRATAIELGERQGLARVIAPILDIDPSNDTDVITTRVVEPGLAVVKQAPALAVVDEEFSYDIGVRNGGELAVRGAQVVDVIPPGLDVVAVESETATCTTETTPPPSDPPPSTDPTTTAPPASAPPVPDPSAAPVVTVICVLPVLPAASEESPAGTAQIRIRVRPTAPGVRTNTACVRVALGESPSPSASASPSSPSPSASGPGPLPRIFEDCDATTTTVHAGDLAVEVTATPAEVLVGERIDATVTVRNLGTAAVPAAVRLSLPAIACEAPLATSCVAVTRDVTLGLLPPGAAVVLEVTLVAVAAGTATVGGRVLPATFDLTATNDVAAASVLVRSPATPPVTVPDPPVPTLRPTLRPTPPIGPPGFVTSIRGQGFPPGATVRLAWSRGLTLNSRPVTVRADGTFAVPMLLAQRDGQLGPRLVIATTAGLAPVRSSTFLLVPGTLDPPDFVVRR